MYHLWKLLGLTNLIYNPLQTCRCVCTIMVALSTEQGNLRYPKLGFLIVIIIIVTLITKFIFIFWIQPAAKAACVLAPLIPHCSLILTKKCTNSYFYFIYFVHGGREPLFHTDHGLPLKTSGCFQCSVISHYFDLV